MWGAESSMPTCLSVSFSVLAQPHTEDGMVASGWLRLWCQATSNQETGQRPDRASWEGDNIFSSRSGLSTDPRADHLWVADSPWLHSKGQMRSQVVKISIYSEKESCYFSPVGKHARETKGEQKVARCAQIQGMGGLPLPLLKPLRRIQSQHCLQSKLFGLALSTCGK